MSTGSGDDVDTLLAILYYMIRVEGSMWRISAGAYALDNRDIRTYDDVELLKGLDQQEMHFFLIAAGQGETRKAPRFPKTKRKMLLHLAARLFFP